MTKQVCISGYYGFNNFGDETILEILIKNLKKFDNSTHITVFSSNPEKTSKELSVNSVYSFNIKELIKTIYKSDCLISRGGSLLQHSTSKKRLIYYLFVIFTAHFFKKNVIIFAQGIGPINNKILNKLTLTAIKKARYITVRDNNSLKLLEGKGINAILYPDPVWNIEIPNVKKTNKIGIQIRQHFSINNEFINILAQSINKHYAGIEIVILSLQNEQDMEISNKLKNELHKINPDIKVYVKENSSNKKIIEEIASLEALIAMRYHACLIGIKSGIKVLPICYDIKVKQLADEFKIKYINPKDTTTIEDNISDFIKAEVYNYNQRELNFNFSEIVKYI